MDKRPHYMITIITLQMKFSVLKYIHFRQLKMFKICDKLIVSFFIPDNHI